MLNYLADFFLIFSDMFSILIISCLGFVYINRGLFFHALCLSAIDIIVNVALKGTFKIPLPPELHPGYAFPSGHMQLSVVFYTWLAIFKLFPYQKWFTGSLLLGIAFGLMHYRYHNLIEVVAALFFGLILVWAYCRFIRLTFSYPSAIILSLFALLMIYNAFQYEVIPIHCWYAFYLLILLIPLSVFFKNWTERNLSLFEKV